MKALSWTDVAAAAEIPDGSATEVIVGDRVIAVFHDGGEWFAMDGMCAHQGGPIAKGVVTGGCVTCPWHGWQYELASGIQTIIRQPLQEVFPCRQLDGRVQVQVG